MYKCFFKRVFDILYSLCLLPFVLVIILVVGILIKLEDRGSIFYNSKRVGKDGKIFKMYKIRSMKENSPDIRLDDGSTFNSDNDPRVTKVGWILRKTSIDELPQLLNVLIGDMSFIGPRPDLPDALNLYSDEEKVKLKVRPGVTGYSQAYFRNSIEMKEKFRNDVFYVNHLTFCLDLKILFKTIDSVVRKKNIYVK